MRYLFYAFYASLFVILIIFAMANRGLVEISIIPGEFSFFGLNFSITLPVYLIFFSGIVLGVVIGFLGEWVRESKYRSEVSQKNRKLREARRELRKLKGEKYKGQDEVLELLDDTA